MGKLYFWYCSPYYGVVVADDDKEAKEIVVLRLKASFDHRKVKMPKITVTYKPSGFYNQATGDS